MTVDGLTLVPWSGLVSLPETTGAADNPRAIARAFDQVFASLLSQSLTSLHDGGEAQGLGGGLFGELAGYAVYQALSGEGGVGLGRQLVNSLGYSVEAEE